MKLANLELKNPVMNASGVCSYPPSLLKRWESAGVAAVVTKSIGTNAQPGYKTPVLIEPYPGVVINAMGLPGPGYKEFLKEMANYDFDVPVIVSIHGQGDDEFSFLVRELEVVADAYELNVSCPHAAAGGYRIGYEPELFRKLLEKTTKSTDKPLSVKLPFYSADERKLETVVGIIEDCGIDWITEINTLRSMDYFIELKRPILGGRDGRGTMGGQSGPSIHGCALAQVYKTRELTDLPIVGVGGIVTAEDAKRFLAVGANAVQLGSGLLYHENNIEDFVKTIVNGIS